MTEINQLQDEIIAEFELFDQWMDRYEYIIELGKKLEPLAEGYKTDDKLIPGCQSRVWLHAQPEDDKIYFYAESDAVITKGIIALLIRVLSGQKAKDIATSDLYFVEQIGLKDHLSPTRSNGLVSMIEQIHSIARNM